MPSSFAAASVLAASTVPDWGAFALVELDVTIDESSAFRVAAATDEFVTRSTDSPANAPFLGTLRKSLAIDQSIVGSRGFGEIAVTVGELEMINTEADYDVLINRPGYGIAGRRVLIKAGRIVDGEVEAYNNFVTIADLTATGWHVDDEILRVTLRDNSYKLEVPAQPEVYAGTGHLEGGTEVSGKRKPWAFGRFPNVTPAPVIPAELVYQVSYRAIQQVDAVYDSGVALTLDADYVTSALLRAATLLPGEYATCLAEGLIRLGGSPDGVVTCTGRGDSAGSYVETTASIVRRIVTVAASVTDPDDLDVSSFSLVNIQQAAPIGYYLDYQSDEMVVDSVRKLMGSIGGWGHWLRSGLFAVRRFAAPSIAPISYYDQYDMLAVPKREPLPSAVDPPPKRFRIRYDRNWTLQESGVVAVVSDDRRAWLATPGRLASTSDADATEILADYPLAQDPEPIEAYFALEADAQAEADRLLALYRDNRALYRIRVKNRVFAHDLGQVINLAYPRFDLDSGVSTVIVELKDDSSENETEMLLFV